MVNGLALGTQHFGKYEFKHGLKNQFQRWYSGQINQLLEAGDNIHAVKVYLKLDLLNPLHVGWMVSALQKVLKECSGQWRLVSHKPGINETG